VSGEPNTPGNAYRVTRVASALPPESFETSVIAVDQLRKRMAELTEADVLWIWRAPYSRRLAAAIDAARSIGARIVFDIDDLLFRPELARSDVIDGNRYLGLLRRTAVWRLYTNLRRALVQADHCTAPTEPLARQIRRLGKSATVVPNGFDAGFMQAADEARRTAAPEGGVVRIGYAAGTFTHQRDLAVAVPALARVLAEHRGARFVTFGDAVDVGEFPELQAMAGQVELRPLVPLDEVAGEYARFDVNIAPLEVGNPFCEAKSELKYFEAALAGAVTVASPTEPFATTVRDGETGFLAADEESWYEILSRLVRDAETRTRVANAARRDALWRFGPERRALLVGRLVTDLVALRDDPPRVDGDGLAEAAP
jgi:glycosyltransferase involved in cell wall biosynthesis